MNRLFVVSLIAIFSSTLAVSAQPKDRDDETTLVEGPLAVTFTTVNTLLKKDERFQGLLLFLTPDRFVVRRAEPGKPGEYGPATTLDANPGTVIQSADGKLRWAASPLANQPKSLAFQGPKVPRRSIDIAPRSVPTRTDDVFTYMALEDIHREVDDVAARLVVRFLSGENPTSHPDLYALKTMVEEYEKLIVQRKLRPMLRTACRETSAAIQRTEERQQALAKWKADGKEDVADLRSAWIAARDRDAAMILKRHAGVNRDIGPMEAGLVTLASLASANYYDDLVNDLKPAAKVPPTRMADLARLFSKYGVDQAAGKKQMLEIGEKHFGGPSARDVIQRHADQAELKKIADFDGLRKHLRESAEAEADNPFAQSRFALWTTAVPQAKRLRWAQDVYEQAIACEKAAQLVPANPGFDGARLLIVARASLVASTAADIETLGRKWGEHWSVYAAHAARLFEIIEKHRSANEMSGLLRERRAWALWQSGQSAEALEQATRIQSMRQTDGRFLVNLARLHCWRSQPGFTDVAFNLVNSAVREGRYRDIVRLKTDPNLAAIQEDKRFLDLVKAQGKLVKIGKGRGFEVINDSAFAVTNVTGIAVRTPNGMKSIAVNGTKADFVPPGAKFVVPNGLVGLKFPVPNGSVDLICDQNPPKK